MEFSDNDESAGRIAALEKRFVAMDALVRGLLGELLDLKTVFRALSRDFEDRSYQRSIERQSAPSTESPVSADLPGDPSDEVSSDGSTLIRPKGSSRPDVQAEPAMVRIMQPDGTMKMEARRGSTNQIDSSAGYGRNVKSTTLRGKKNP